MYIIHYNLFIMDKKKSIQYFQLATQVANIFSKDASTKVGAIILAPKSFQVLSLGYNGMPRGITETDYSKWERPLKYKYVEHAERNALYNACRHGTPLAGSIAIVTMFPCSDCARGLIQAGITTIITTYDNTKKERWGCEWDISNSMFKEAGIDIIILTSEDISSEINVTIETI